MGMDEREVQGRSASTASLRGKLLFNPIVIWMAHCFFAYTIGYVIIANTLDKILLGGRGFFGFLLSVEGACGVLSSANQAHMFACRLFYPFEVITLYYAPNFIIGSIYWLMVFVRERRAVWLYNRRQRWAQVWLMSIFPLLYVLISLKQFKQNFFFDPYGPYLPILLSASALITPLLVWRFIDALKKPRKGTLDV
ncbi:MAG: hypothetical protein U5N55_13700 [Cypionkella sp.]|nr:hypothetical protein [Cypionkella sp.]